MKRFGWVCLILLFLGSCTKDPSLYREYVYGQTWLLTQIDGQSVPGYERDILYFKNYSSYSIQTVAKDSSGFSDLAYSDGWYSIYCRDFSFYLSMDEVVLSETWDIIRFTENQIRATIVEKSYDSDTSALVGKEVLYERMDVSTSYADSIKGTWDAVQEQASSAPFSVEFNATGYTFYFKDQDGQWVAKEDEKGSYILYGTFLRTRSFNNLFWGEQNKFALAAWTLSFFTNDEGLRCMRWDNLDKNLSYSFVPRS